MSEDDKIFSRIIAVSLAFVQFEGLNNLKSDIFRISYGIENIKLFNDLFIFCTILRLFTHGN